MDLVTIFSFSLFFILFLRWVLKRREIFATFEKLGIPGPKPSFFVGNVLEMLSKTYCEVDWVEKYGPIYGFFYGAIPVLGIADPELLKIIQVKEPEIFHARNLILPKASVPSDIFDKSVAVIGGPRWKENRDSVTPAYTTSKFKSMNGVMNKEIDEAISKIAKSAENQQSCNLQNVYSSLFGKVSLQISFGIKLNDTESKAGQLMLESLGRPFLGRMRDTEVYLSVSLPEIQDLLSHFRVMREKIRKAFNCKSASFINEICGAAINARTAEKANSYIDVLQLMLNAVTKKERSNSVKNDDLVYSKKDQMQEDDVLPNSFYIASATYNLIKNITLYATYEIAKSPRVQEKLRKEILDINGNQKHINYDNLIKMQYLDQAFNEAIRLHPTVPFFSTRICGKDYYYKGQLIPKGMTVHVPQIGMQRSALYFPDPDAFIPERFDDKSKIDPYIYQPFGIGQRHCLGMRLTQYFSKLTLARMVQAFNLSVDPNAKEVRPDVGFVMYRPKDPVIIKATPVQ